MSDLRAVPDLDDSGLDDSDFEDSDLDDFEFEDSVLASLLVSEPPSALGFSAVSPVSPFPSFPALESFFPY